MARPEQLEADAPEHELQCGLLDVAVLSKIVVTKFELRAVKRCF
jgi:hypothetical protein